MDILKIGGRRTEAAKLAACAAVGALAGAAFLRRMPGTDGIGAGILAGLACYGIYRLAARLRDRR